MVSLRLLLASALLGATSLVSAQIDWTECDVPDFTGLVGDGNGGGGGWCASKWKQGILINSIRAQADSLSLRGLRIGFTDNTYVDVGAPWSTGGREGEIRWDPLNDRIKSVETWATGWVGGMGRLIMETTNDGRFDAGNDHSGSMGNRLNIGSGMLIGMRGRHGGTEGAIDNLEFMFANSNPREYRLDSMTLTPSIDEINQRESNGERGLKVESLNVVHFINRTPGEMTAGITGTREESESTEYSQSVSTTFGLSLGFEMSYSVGLPGAATLGGTISSSFSWEQSTQKTDTRGSSHSTTSGYSGEITVEPNTAARCTAFSLSGELDIKWSGTNVVVFEDDSEWHYQSGGDYNTVSTSQAWVTCEPEELTEAEDAEANGARVEDPRTVDLGGPALPSRRQMGPVKRLSGKKN
ncbi:hypothetical protein B0I35DRAFT_407124 [Stachybotrys elegans]|uniref:Jacalin-type lectin domain-containing protein n=1 Tax=Stachybotrys elegans TaxID=80388 RepID=A0A8K0WTC3_9HYPO|nr:hypothetical protein B0I35DRAFT_407124 [Stachybotrys elegans]